MILRTVLESVTVSGSSCTALLPAPSRVVESHAEVRAALQHLPHSVANPLRALEEEGPAGLKANDPELHRLELIAVPVEALRLPSIPSLLLALDSNIFS